MANTLYIFQEKYNDILEIILISVFVSLTFFFFFHINVPFFLSFQYVAHL